jgi:hypothetical protein
VTNWHGSDKSASLPRCDWARGDLDLALRARGKIRDRTRRRNRPVARHFDWGRRLHRQPLLGSRANRASACASTPQSPGARRQPAICGDLDLDRETRRVRRGSAISISVRTDGVPAARIAT